MAKTNTAIAKQGGPLGLPAELSEASAIFGRFVQLHRPDTHNFDAFPAVAIELTNGGCEIYQDENTGTERGVVEVVGFYPDGTPVSVRGGAVLQSALARAAGVPYHVYRHAAQCDSAAVKQLSEALAAYAQKRPKLVIVWNDSKPNKPPQSHTKLFQVYEIDPPDFAAVIPVVAALSKRTAESLDKLGYIDRVRARESESTPF